MTWSDLPTVNACLNTLSATFLVLGWACIRQGKREAHRRFMVAALTTSTLFLISYLVYHFEVGSTRFQGQGWIRPVYFALLLSHTVLAAAIVPMVLTTVLRALRQEYDAHRRLARWTLPLWLYVSVTGVMIYFLLYHAYPPT